MRVPVKIAIRLCLAGFATTLAARTRPDRLSISAPLRYEFLRGGEIVGHETVANDGLTTTARFEGIDGGRPWEIDESATLDATGIPTSVDVTGADAAGTRSAIDITSLTAQRPGRTMPRRGPVLLAIAFISRCRCSRGK